MVGINLGVDSSCDESEPAMIGNRITGSVGGPGGPPEASGDGITVGPLAQGTLVEGNWAVRNTGNGISVLDPSTRLSGNLAVRNGAFGIWAPYGAIDLGGNRALANGDPAQCVGVQC